MRLRFRLSKNTSIVPFDYQHHLIGAFHQMLGWNEIHNAISLYSLSWLQGGRIAKTGFNYEQGSEWLVSIWDDEIAKKLISGALSQFELFFGMKIVEIGIQPTPIFSNHQRFVPASPIFIRKYDENKKAIHLLYDNPESDFFLTEAMKKKLKTVGLDYEIKIEFDRSYPKPKTKLVHINNIASRASMCPVIIEGDPKAVEFSWNVGVGHSTGSGFGAIY
ncbi:MAG: CRISPR-associated endoribonuclease Cas6 [Candidatus Kapabacteria bacterium]|nr:CRISPR-associated endoribonuclease Cas6 [Candidatus Kapabacteria bacterium]